MKFVKRAGVLLVTTILVGMTIACSTSTVPAPTMIPTPSVTVLPSSPVPPAPASATPTPLPTVLATVTRTTTALPTLTLTPTLVDAKVMALQAFDNAIAKLKTYRVVIPQESRYIAVQLPDRFLQEGFDSILRIGPTMWVAGVYDIREMPAVDLPFFNHANIHWYKARFAESTQVILLGPGTVENVPCVGYSATFNTTVITPPKNPNEPLQSTQIQQTIKIWFATTDGFPRRAELGPPISLTVNFYDLNLDFTIAPP
ncbi:MAG: hypothetical protein N2559_00140 [Anaerolineae bacterium]|nr:hypothetical protein [Anaerolineae bacterium]